MEVSIIIVSWNTREILRECLASVFGTLGGLSAEVLVVDNASTDGSPEMVVECFPQVRLIRNTENLGFAAANNQALRLSTGRYYLLLNSDTVLLKEVVQRSLEYLDARPETGAMGCRVLNADGTMQRTCSRFPTQVNLLLMCSGLDRVRWPRFLGRYQIRDWQRDSEREVDAVSGCYLLARAQAVRQVGMLDEGFFFYGEETDWCRRFWDCGWRLCFAPVGEIIHYGSASSRQCNHRRDLMLTTGLIRYHRKHAGQLAAALVFAELAAFNASRAAFWSLRSVFSSKPETRARRNHFFGVVRGFAAAWQPVREKLA